MAFVNAMSGQAQPAGASVPSFLTLPQELKNEIYKDLLNPISPFQYPEIIGVARKRTTTATKRAVYKDTNKNGSQSSLPYAYSSSTPKFPHSYGLHPAILRVNQQIHDEAATFLYKNLDCEINFYKKNIGGLEGQVYQQYFFCDPKGLVDSRSHTCALTGAGQRCFVQVFAPKRQCNWKELCTAKDILNLHCLWSVRDIMIIVSWSSIFGQGNWTEWEQGYCHKFTHMGTLLLEVLRHINEEPIIPTTKELLITTEGGDSLETFVTNLDLWRDGTQELQAMDSRMRGMYDGVTEIITLLQSINKRRSVLVTERVSYDSKQDLNWENFPW